MFPPVNDAVRTGGLTVDIAKQAWADIAGQFVPSPTVVVLYGSVVAGNAKPYSDIDLLLISYHGDRVRRRPVAENGYLFDITLFPANLASQVATEASRSLGPGRITAFMHGIVIAGDAALFEGLKADVERIYAGRSQNQRFLLAGMENSLLGMLTDSTFTPDSELCRCYRQEAKFVALNILSVRIFGEVLPPSIMIQKSHPDLRKLVIEILNFPIDDGPGFVDFIGSNIGFAEIRGWHVETGND